MTRLAPPLSLKGALIVILLLSITLLSLLSYASALSIYPNRVSTSLEFDGMTGSLMANGTSAEPRIQANGITITLWTMIYPLTPQSSNPLFDQRGYQFSLSGGSNNGTRFMWQVWNSSGSATSVVAPNAFTLFGWYFIAANWDALTGNVVLYVNGAEVAHGQGPTSVNLRIGQDSDQWLVGRNHYNDSIYGRIANLQIYSGVLPTDTIATLNNMGQSGQPLAVSNLDGWWRLNGDFSSYDGRNGLQPSGGVRWIKSTFFVFPYDVLSVFATYSTVSSILALAPTIPKIRNIRVFKPLLANYQPFVLAVFLKIFLALITPLSLDFLNILQSSSFSDLPLGFSPSEGGFWFLIVHTFSQLWTFTPVSHPNIQAIFRSPFDVYRNNVPLPAGSYLIPFFTEEGGSGLFAWVMLAKLPYVALDIAIGVVTYHIMLVITGSNRIASTSMILWLFNPVSTILIDLWSSNDALMVLFLTTSVYALLRGRTGFSALFYGLAIAVRLVPIAFLPVMLVALRHREGLRFENSKTSTPDRFRKLFPQLRIPLIICGAVVVPNIPLFLVKSGLPLISAPSIQPSSILLSSSYDYLFGITFASPSVNLGDFRYGIAIILLSMYTIFVVKTWASENRFVVDAFVGLILTLLVLSQWNAQYWLWILPFIIMKIHYDPKSRNLFLLQLSLLMLVNFTIFSFYYSTFGRSIFFFPNYTPLAQAVSSAFSAFHDNPIFRGLRLDEVLISTFAAINIWILAKLSWPRIFQIILRSSRS